MSAAGRALGSLFVACSLAVGCSSSTPENGRCPATPPGGVAVDDYCAEFAQILCEGYHSCCEIEDLEGCIDRVFDECEAGEISSIRAGNSCLDGAVARGCLDAWDASFDDCLRNEDIGEACRYQWYGHAEVGEPCRAVWWCQRGLSCQLEGTSGICIQLPAEGESCAETASCAPGGLFCSYEDWTCHQEPDIGEPCEREGTCAVGHCAADGLCQPTPWCG